MQMARVAFSRMDADGDGSITKEEFLQYVAANKKENGGTNQMSFRSIQPKSSFNPADFKTLASTKDERLVNQLVDKIFMNVDADRSGGWSF
jgi:Ca2+-binding EF-hand superfamily protein